MKSLFASANVAPFCYGAPECRGPKGTALEMRSLNALNLDSPIDANPGPVADTPIRQRCEAAKRSRAESFAAFLNARGLPKVQGVVGGGVAGGVGGVGDAPPTVPGRPERQAEAVPYQREAAETDRQAEAVPYHREAAERVDGGGPNKTQRSQSEPPLPREEGRPDACEQAQILSACLESLLDQGAGVWVGPGGVGDVGGVGGAAGAGDVTRVDTNITEAPEEPRPCGLLEEHICFQEMKFTLAYSKEGMTREDVVAMYCRISPKEDPGWVLAGQQVLRQVQGDRLEGIVVAYADGERMVDYFLEETHVVLTDIALAVTKAYLEARGAEWLGSYRAGGPDLVILKGFQALLEKFQANLVPSILLETWASQSFVRLGNVLPDHIRVCVHNCLMEISRVVRPTQAPSLFPRQLQQTLAGAS